MRDLAYGSLKPARVEPGRRPYEAELLSGTGSEVLICLSKGVPLSLLPPKICHRGRYSEDHACVVEGIIQNAQA